MKWWAKHYEDLYSTENIISDTAFDYTPALSTMEEIDLSPTEDELGTAVDSLSH